MQASTNHDRVTLIARLQEAADAATRQLEAAQTEAAAALHALAVEARRSTQPAAAVKSPHEHTHTAARTWAAFAAMHGPRDAPGCAAFIADLLLLVRASVAAPDTLPTTAAVMACLAALPAQLQVKDHTHSATPAPMPQLPTPATLALLWQCLPHLYRLPDVSKEDAFTVFCEAAALGLGDGLVHMANCYMLGHGVKQDAAKALILLRQACERDMPLAFGMLGDCLYRGVGLIRDEPEAKRLWRRGADLGDLHCFARCNFFAIGCKKNEVEVVRLLRLSLEIWPSAFSCYFLGDCLYKNGFGVAVNTAEGSRLIRKAADQGCAMAQNCVGIMLSRGKPEISSKNHAEAVAWYRRAAVAGFAQAQYNVGNCYELGTGTDVDQRQATYWYELAADKQHNDAVFTMAERHETGLGLDRPSLLQARQHFARAMHLGHWEAAGRLNASMAGVFWSFPLRCVFSPAFNRVLMQMLAAARIAQRTQELPFVPPELWALIWGFLPYIPHDVDIDEEDDVDDDEDDGDIDNEDDEDEEVEDDEEDEEVNEDEDEEN